MSIKHRWAYLRAALSTLLFCVGMIILPFLAMADLTVWVVCGDRDRQACVQQIEDAITSSANAEVGEIELPANGPLLSGARAPQGLDP